MNEYDFVTDDDLDEMYGEQERRGAPAPLPPQVTPLTPPGAQPIGSLNGLPLYPLALAQVPAASSDSLLTRRFGPLPVWGWALTALGTGLGGYFLWQSQKKSVSKNDGEDEGSSSNETQDEEPSSGGRSGWGPSRGSFAQQLNGYFSRKGLSSQVRIFDDADEAKAKGKLKFISPLINITCGESGFKPDRELERLCKRDGLKPVVHQDGTIGLYPAENTKRGREWEKYIDLLRDDGQTV